MTLPNGAAGLSGTGLDYAFSASKPGSIPGAVQRTQDNVSAALKAQMQGSEGWQSAHTAAYSGLLGRPGTPLVLKVIVSIASRITGIPADEIVNDVHGALLLIEKVPIIGDLVELITGVEDGDDYDLGTYFLNFRKFFAGLNFLDPNFNPITAAAQFVNLVLMPLNLLLTRHSQIQLSSLTNDGQQMLWNPSFSGAISIAGNGVWFWDSDVFYVDPDLDAAEEEPGSVRVVADGTIKALRSNKFDVTKGQTLNFSARAMTSGLVGATGIPAPPLLKFMLVPYKGSERVGDFVELDTADEVLGETTNWTGAPAGAKSIHLSGSYTVPDGVDNIRLRLVVTSAALAGSVWFDAASALRVTEGLPTGWVAGLSVIVTMVNQIFGIIQGDIIVPINNAVAQFQDWVIGLGNGFVAILTALLGGFTHGSGEGATPAEVGNAAALTAAIANSAVSLGELNNEVLAIRNNKSLFSGIDETEESNFLLDKMFTSTTEPPKAIAASAAAVPVSYWRAEEAAVKGFITWIGRGAVNELHLDVYRANYQVNMWDWVHTSPNLGLLTQASWKYTQYNIAEVLDRLDTKPGEVYGLAWRVVGAGTHYIAGISAGTWMGDHPTAIPARMASVRTGVGNLPFGSTTYSNDVGWFGIGIISGDVRTPVYAPRQTVFPGKVGGTGAAVNYLGFSDVYDVPDLVRAGDIFDFVMVGDGGGGNYHAFSPGGAAGKWKGVRLVYGVDIPVTTKRFYISSGPGGDGGSSANDAGDWGLGTFVVIPGYGIISAEGGARSAAPGYNGQSPGNFEWQGVPYRGGGATGSAAQAGVAPGGGGHNAGPVYQKGGTGAPGCVWITVSQGDPRVPVMDKPAAPAIELLEAKPTELLVGVAA